MTSSYRLKSAVSTLRRNRMQSNTTTLTVRTRKPFIKNVSPIGYGSCLKHFLNGSLSCNLSHPKLKKRNYHSFIGDNYDETRIPTLQPNEVQPRCQDSNSENWQSLQVQYQLPYYMDSEVQTESFERQGGRCA